MSPHSKKEYLKTVWLRYQKASPKAEKSKILDELCANCHFNRKYAIRRIRNFKIIRRKKAKNKPGPKPKYQQPEFLTVLRQIWIAANLPCSKRLKAIFPVWLPGYQEEFGALPSEILKRLTKISPASIDRVLRPIKHLYRGKGRCATKPGLLLKHHIPIKTNQWNESKPGFLEADTVHHCGTSMAGIYAVTTNALDIATGWNEQRATSGIGHRAENMYQYESYFKLPVSMVALVFLNCSSSML